MDVDGAVLNQSIGLALALRQATGVLKHVWAKVSVGTIITVQRVRGVLDVRTPEWKLKCDSQFDQLLRNMCQTPYLLLWGSVTGVRILSSSCSADDDPGADRGSPDFACDRLMRNYVILGPVNKESARAHRPDIQAALDKEKTLISAS